MLTRNFAMKPLPLILLQFTAQSAFNATDCLVEFGILIPLRHRTELSA